MREIYVNGRDWKSEWKRLNWRLSSNQKMTKNISKLGISCKRTEKKWMGDYEIEVVFTPKKDTKIIYWVSKPSIKDFATLDEAYDKTKNIGAVYSKGGRFRFSFDYPSGYHEDGIEKRSLAHFRMCDTGTVYTIELEQSSKILKIPGISQMFERVNELFNSTFLKKNISCVLILLAILYLLKYIILSGITIIAMFLIYWYFGGDISSILSYTSSLF
jgi:hypothetical protein